MRAIPRLAVISGLVLALALAAAGAARAEYLKFNGTHAIRFSHNGVIREVSKSGTGVAFVNRAGSDIELNTLELTRPFATMFATITATRLGSEPGTMGTTTPGSNEVPELRVKGVRIDAKRAGLKGFPGVFKPIHGALAATMGKLTFNTLPAKGTVRLCFGVLQPCKTGGTLPVNLSQKETTPPTSMGMTYAIGPGVGGTFTAVGMSGTSVMAVGNPWTIKTAMATYGKKGGTGMLTSAGFAKGPPGTMGGMLGTTLANGGVGGMVQLVTPIQATCVGACGGINDPSAQIARLTLTFQPEPGSFVSLCAGAVALALLGRRRVDR